MPLDIVVGTQWGDEGKGRFVTMWPVSTVGTTPGTPSPSASRPSNFI
jgi:hypothetical protein